MVNPAMAQAAADPGPWVADDDFALLDAMPAHTAILNSRGDIMAVSESWRQFAFSNGYDDPALGIGRNYLEICAAAGDDLVAAKVRHGIMQILAARRSGLQLEYPCHAPDKHRWFRLHAAPIAFKRELGALVMHTDITDEFRARRDLRRGIARFQEIAEIVSDWLWETDAAFRVTYLSERFSQLFEMPVDQAVGRELGDVLALLEGSENERRFRGLLSTGRRFRDETFRLTLPDGRVRTCRFSGGPIVDSSGVLRGYRGTGADITEQLAAQAKAEATSRRFLEAIDKMPRAITLWDENDVLIHANGAYKSVYPGLHHILEPGLKFETLYRAIVDHGFIIVSDPDREGFIRRRLIARRQSSHDITYRMGNGRWVQIATDLLSDGSLVNSHTDVTAQKQAEARARHMQKMDAVGTLAGGIAHELNNALVPIISLTQHTLKKMPAGSREQESLAIVATAALRSRDLVGKILNFSRKSAGASGVTRVADGIRAAAKAIVATLPERISLATVIADDVGAARIESNELQQVLINLATNAVQAIGDGSGAIRIAAAMDAMTHEGGRRAVRITVSDDGPGIPAAVRERIFEPFFTTKPPGQGTGLGLSLVHSIVAIHGGSIELASEPGAGATFHVRLEESADAAAPGDLPAQ